MVHHTILQLLQYQEYIMTTYRFDINSIGTYTNIFYESFGILMYLWSLDSVHIVHAPMDYTSLHYIYDFAL